MPTLDGRAINAVADIPDEKDWHYRPPLIRLRREMLPPAEARILNQGQEGACTGFGLAAVINRLNDERGSPVRVSQRMLYEMARKFDRWPGEDYAGSSCRGAIKGWYHMGVCTASSWPYVVGNPGHLTVTRAKEARSNTIGAYYRIEKNIVHMHAALNETGVVYVSANVHEGWRAAAIRDGAIKYKGKPIGGHAFAVVGYDATGFFVQNSWGKAWGKKGVAHWSYEDWQDNVRDAWVVRLALPTPQIWGRTRGGAGDGAKSNLFSSGPRRDEIAGHFAHIDDGAFHDEGRYWSTLGDVQETASHIARSPDYDHLLIYAHGGLNSIKDSARRVAAMKDVFKANRVYPYHFMYDTGLMEELKDIILGKRSNVEGMVGGFTDWWDRVFERATRRPGRALWREMKADADSAFRGTASPGSQTLRTFLKELRKGGGRPKKIHLVGHSTGAILHAHLLRALASSNVKTRIASVSLLAPAATVDLFDSHYWPLLKTPKKRFGIDKLCVYNLTDRAEQDDTVAGVYRKSLLYLVSHAFEETVPAPILGMERDSSQMPGHRNLSFVYSKGENQGTDASQSATHGGFDNDPHTMNDVLKRILGKAPVRPFAKDDLEY
jgi:Papain family cysteine protease/Alpha/beta hydrolase of unknown function (DUF900)